MYPCDHCVRRRLPELCQYTAPAGEVDPDHHTGSLVGASGKTGPVGRSGLPSYTSAGDQQSLRALEDHNSSASDTDIGSGFEDFEGGVGLMEPVRTHAYPA
jgi:hypothetical protein